MENKIIEILQNGVLSSKTIATKLGKRNVKDIQKTLNKLLNRHIIKKGKLDNNRLQLYSLVDVNDSSDVKNISDKNKPAVNNGVNTTLKKLSQPEINPLRPSYQDLLLGIVNSYKDEIIFLRNEIKQKNELIVSQQQVINMLVVDEHKNPQPEQQFQQYNKTFKNSKVAPIKLFENVNRFEVLSQPEKDDEDSLSLSSEEEENTYHDTLTRGNVKQKQYSRPDIVNSNKPVKQHYKNKIKNKQPLIALIGDSTIKQLSGYQLSKKCQGTTVMVRSQQGGKIKNIKNLMIDILEDVSPDAICIHVATNDINGGRSVNEIIQDMENLIMLIQRQGIVPVFSLVTRRADKYSSKVDIINNRLIQLCNHHGVGYIEHQNITKNHLNSGGLHIAREHISLFSDNFAKYFKYLSVNNFCIQ